MNVELLEKVKQHILEEPRRLNMQYVLIASSTAPCGTVGCVAGWAMFLTGAMDKYGYLIPSECHRDNYDIAMEKLGLNKQQTGKLFDFSKWNIGYHWPANFENAYNNAETPEERARVTVARIDHFIATNGAE